MEQKSTRREFLALSATALAYTTFGSGCIGLKRKVNYQVMKPLNEFTKSGIHYYEKGSGSNIVFVHGWGGRAEEWQAEFKSLSIDHHVYAIDLPGFGYSPKPDRKYTIDESANDLEAFIKEKNLEKVFLVAQSRGTSVSRRYAAKNPEKVSGMVLCSAYINGYTELKTTIPEWLVRTPLLREFFLSTAKIFGGRNDVIKNIRSHLFDKSRVSEDSIESFYEIMQRKDGFDAFVESGRNLDLSMKPGEEEAIRNIPYVYLAGDKDSLIIVKNWNHQKLIKLKDTGHLMSIDRPELLVGVIRIAVRNTGEKDNRKFVSDLKTLVEK